jgi:hypothetical protein
MKCYRTTREFVRAVCREKGRIACALSVGLVPEPALRISNKRVFQQEDIDRLAAHFGTPSSSREEKGLQMKRKSDDDR